VRLKILSSKEFENSRSRNVVVKVYISMNLERMRHIMSEQLKTAYMACYIYFSSNFSFCEAGKFKIFITGKNVKLSLYLIKHHAVKT
jgi:hypothetical protein